MTLAEVRASKETHAMYRPGVEGRTILKGEKPFFIPGCKVYLDIRKYCLTFGANLKQPSEELIKLLTLLH